MRHQGADAVLMVRPAGFGFNAQTAASNVFQRAGAPDVREAARAQFDSLVEALRVAGVGVCVVEEPPDAGTPDAIFPNNWISFHGSGVVVLYPMMAPNRRTERRRDVLDAVATTLGYHHRALIDLSAHERGGRFLEGTGSLVLDHVRRLAYAVPGPRTDALLAADWARELGFRLVLFDASDELGRTVYHTNVVLAIGESWAVLNTEAVPEAQRGALVHELSTGRELIEIDHAAMRAFAANILALRTAAGRRVLALSVGARRALERHGDAWQRLGRHLDAVVTADVGTIEAVGGGSVRCMLAEVRR